MKLFNRQTSNKDYNMNLGRSIVEFIAQDNANKIASRKFTFAIPDENVSANVETTLIKSKFNRLKKKMEKDLSRNGKAAMGILVVDGEAFLDIVQPLNWERVANQMQWIHINTGELYVLNETKYPKAMMFNKTPEGLWKVRNGYTNSRNVFKALGKQEYTYPNHVKKCPIVLFANNEESKSDVENTKMWDAIDQLDRISNDFSEEWEYVKTRYLNNLNFTDKDAQDQMRRFKNGDRVLDATDPDGKLEGALQVLTSGSNSVILAGNAIDYIEDKILKYTFTMRDTVQSGANKQTTEVAIFNQFAAEYLLNKMEIRNEDYTELFNTLIEIIYGLENKTTNVVANVVIELSELERAKIDALNNTAAVNKGAQNVKQNK